MIRIYKKYIIRTLIGASLILILAFIWLDMLDNNIRSINVKYDVIAICFVLTLLIGKDGYNNQDKTLLQGARFFTLLADYYLLLAENYRIGIMFFCIVQLLYITRHSLMERKPYKNIIFLLCSGIIFTMVFNMLKLEHEYKILAGEALIYAALLSTSVYCALICLKQGKYNKINRYFIASGMFLFLLCDISVGLFNIFTYLSLEKYSNTVVFLIWIFYAPSQLLLSLSGFREEVLKEVFIIKDKKH